MLRTFAIAPRFSVLLAGAALAASTLLSVGHVTAVDAASPGPTVAPFPLAPTVDKVTFSDLLISS